MIPVPPPSQLRTVRQLKPGDVIRSGMDSAIFIIHGPHPVPKYNEQGFRLVIWRLLSRSGSLGEYSFDTLLPEQEVGEALAQTDDERWFYDVAERLEQYNGIASADEFGSWYPGVLSSDQEPRLDQRDASRADRRYGRRGPARWCSAEVY